MHGEEARENARDCSKIDDLFQPGSIIVSKRDDGVCVFQERGIVASMNQSVACCERIHDNDVEYADKDERSAYCKRHVASRVLRFFAQCRSCVEANEGENAEDDPQSYTREAGWGGGRRKDAQ